MKKQVTLNGMPTVFESFPGGVIKSTTVIKERATAKSFKHGIIALGFKPEQVQVMARHDGQFTILVTCTAQEVIKIAGGR